MKKFLLSFIFTNCLFMLNFAHADEIIGSASVISSTPVVEHLYAPSRDCNHPSYSRYDNSPDPGKAILGALIGGAAASNIGKGSGKDAATALGAIIGSKIADPNSGPIAGEEILGMLIGGAAGRSVGKGSGKTVATAVGALAGSAIGQGLVSRNRNDFARVCGNRVVSRNVITSYDVEFEYGGYILTGNLPYKPGREIDVLVSVEVLADNTRNN